MCNSMNYEENAKLTKRRIMILSSIYEKRQFDADEN